MLSTITKTLQICKKLFFAAVLILPFSIAAFLSTRRFIRSIIAEDGGVDKLRYITYGMQNPLVSIILVIIFMAAVFIFYFYGLDKKYFQKQNTAILSAFVIIMALLPRLFIYFSYESVLIPYSDANHVWSIAMGNTEKLFLKSFQNGWNNFTAAVVFLVRNLGVPYEIFILGQFIIDVFIAYYTYKICEVIFDNLSIPFLAAVIYALNPTAILKSLYLTPDNISQLFTTIAVFLLIKDIDNFKIFNIRSFSKSLIIGLRIGIANVFKGSAPVIFVAYIIVVIYKILADKYSKKQIASTVVFFLALVSTSLAIGKVALNTSSHILGVECKNLALPHMLYVGLKPDGQGQLTYGEYPAYYETLLLEGYDEDTALYMAAEKLAELWQKCNYNPIPLISGKLNFAYDANIESWGRTGILSTDTSAKNNYQQKLDYIINYYGVSFMQVTYIFIMVSGCIGVVFLSKKCFNNDGAFMILLYVFGYAILLLLTECQSRYKMFIMQFVCIIAAFGFYQFMIYLVHMAASLKKNITC